MPLLLNDILHLSAQEIDNSKIELNMRAGSNGESFLDVWLEYSNKEKLSGICTECSYWGWYGSNKNFYIGQVVFSFIRMQSDDEWLLISVGKVTNIPENGRAEVKIVDKFKSLFGRLIINLKKGNTFSRYAFNLSTYLDKAVVKAILPTMYNGEIFEGYDRIHLSFGKLQSILKGKISPTYYEALKKITGVYCLTDTKTGKLYIGSATGIGGVAERWGNYLDSKHGGNVELIKLYNEKGEEYFKNNFNFTLLEYFGLSYDSDKIKAREQYWKMCLDTINHGYNDN